MRAARLPLDSLPAAIDIAADGTALKVTIEPWCPIT
jgi:hypothetical protein